MGHEAVPGCEASLFPLGAEGNDLNTGTQGDRFENSLKIRPIPLHKIHRDTMRQLPLNHLGQQQNLRGQLRALDTVMIKQKMHQPKNTRSRQHKHEQMEKRDPAGHGGTKKSDKPSISAVDDEIIHRDYPILARAKI